MHRSENVFAILAAALRVSLVDQTKLDESSIFNILTPAYDEVTPKPRTSAESTNSNRADELTIPPPIFMMLFDTVDTLLTPK
jgi:hypothetical protein